MENSRVVSATLGKASCMAARHSQCTLASKPSRSPARARAQVPVHTAPRRRDCRAWDCSQVTHSRWTLRLGVLRLGLLGLSLLRLGLLPLHRGLVLGQG